MRERDVSAATGLEVSLLSKTFGLTPVLRDVTLSVRAGTVHGLLGGNGSGKSTLIKILAGVHTGDPGGRVTVGAATAASDAITPDWSRAAGLRFVHQDLGLFESLTVAENLFAGARHPRRRGRIDWRALRREAQALLDGFEVDVPADAELRAIRPADRTLVAIVRCLQHRLPRGGVLLLDEPTARLPGPEVERLLAALARYRADGHTIVFVTHYLDEVLEVCDDVTVLRDGEAVTRQPTDGLTSADLAELIVGHAVDTDRPVVARDHVSTDAAPALEVRDLRGGPLFGVDLAVAPGEIVGVAGLVGSGRTTLLELLYGASPRAGGEVAVAGAALPAGSVPAAIAAGVAYVPEDRAAHAAFLSLGVPMNLSAARTRDFRRGGFLRATSERDAARSLVERFGIRLPQLEAPVRTLSGGNQQKVVLARWLQSEPAVLLLDEPTQGVDVGARDDIYTEIEAAAAGGVAVLVVSSDFDELVRLADRVVVLAGGTLAHRAERGAFDRRWLAEHVYTGSRHAHV